MFPPRIGQPAAASAPAMAPGAAPAAAGPSVRQLILQAMMKKPTAPPPQAGHKPDSKMLPKVGPKTIAR